MRVFDYGLKVAFFLVFWKKSCVNSACREYLNSIILNSGQIILKPTPFYEMCLFI